MVNLCKWHLYVKWQGHSFQVEISPAVSIEKTNNEVCVGEEERLAEGADIFEPSNVFDSVLHI